MGITVILGMIKVMVIEITNLEMRRIPHEKFQAQRINRNKITGIQLEKHYLR